VKTSLDHLPAYKQDELRAITAVIREAAPMLETLILFGSHARTDWVEDEEGGYFSDYDLLAIVERRKVAEDVSLWARVEEKAREVPSKALVSLIAHDFKFVNDEIRVGSYFFGDIRNEGIVLYEQHHRTLATPKEANAGERLERAERNFAYWFESAQGFIDGWGYHASKKRNNHAIFELHQASERLYVAACLVFTGYKRKEHDLRKLHVEAAPLHPELAGVLPRSSPEDGHLFDLLRRGYIDARYVKSYRVTDEELAVIGERVKAFAAVVERICTEKIAALRAEAERAGAG
jgi:predicted nucleotidyltransferase/HEPN domain-containing protein